MAKTTKPVAVHPAIVRYAPPAIGRVATSVLNPDIERQVAMLTARPRSMRRVPAGQVDAVVSHVRDPKVLAALIRTADHRRITRQAFARHPMLERALFVNLDLSSPWAEHSLEQVETEIASILSYRSLTHDDQRRLTHWCRRRHPAERAVAYKRLYDFDPSGRSAVPDLLVDVVLGRVDGLTATDLGCFHDPERPYTIHRTARLGSLNDVVARFDRLDLPLARFCTENNVNPPLDSVDVIDDDAFEHLLSDGSAVKLIERGLLDDPRRLLPVADRFDERSRAKLAFMVSDPDVVAALISGIVYGKQHYLDLFSLLNNVPGLDWVSRMTCLSYASPSELRDYLNGMTLNQPEEGDGACIVETILRGDGPKWTVSGQGTLAYVLGSCAPTPYALEAVNLYVELLDGSMATLLDNAGLLGRFAVERITATLGDDQPKWEMLLRLAPDWTGNLDELISTANLL